MQIVGEMWLMVKLTGSGAAVGLTAGLQFLPILLFGAWGGLLADRLPKRRAADLHAAVADGPGADAVRAGRDGRGRSRGWCSALVLVRGTVLAIDNPARQSFVVEIVGSDRVVNAVALNSVVVHCSRIIGPALAGTIIALVGIAPCFLVNAFSFLAMFIALRTMDARALQTPKPAVRATRRGAQRAALRAAARPSC